MDNVAKTVFTNLWEAQQFRGKMSDIKPSPKSWPDKITSFNLSLLAACSWNKSLLNGTNSTILVSYLFHFAFR